MKSKQIYVICWQSTNYKNFAKVSVSLPSPLSDKIFFRQLEKMNFQFVWAGGL